MENVNQQKVLKLNKKQNDLINEEDIMHLFLGLVKLVKKNAQYEANKTVVKQINELKNQIESLKQLVVEKENFIKILQTKN